MQIADAQDVPENLEEATIVQLQSALTAGRWTSSQLLEKYLARIRDVDRNDSLRDRAESGSGGDCGGA